MSFMKALAPAAGGLTGLAAVIGGKKKPSPSLVSSPSPSAISTTGVSTPSLMTRGY